MDPLEGTNLCATGAANSIAVLAASEAGGLLHAPDCYMEKIIAGPGCQGALDLDAPPADNLKAIAKRLDRDVDDLVVMVLDRPRHEGLIAAIRKAGARIRLIGDGDLSAGIAAAVRGAGVHAVMGIGGAPEGVITAAAMRCLHGEMLGRLVVRNKEMAKRMEKMGIQRSEEDLSRRRPGARQEYYLRGLRRHARISAARRAILRRRPSHPLSGNDVEPEHGQLPRYGACYRQARSKRGSRLILNKGIRFWLLNSVF